MQFTVNGKSRELPGEPTVGDYIQHLGVNRLSVAVELDGVVIKRDTFETTFIRAGSKMEIVRMMGGG